jgi:DNA-binding response OmpR family regulator
MKILIAEDDSFLGNAYKMKLTKAGHELQLAADGEAALKKLESFTPDVIVLDLIMPNIDGFGVLEKVKADDRFKNIPVIVASNLGQEEDIKKAKKLGANDYVIKSDLSLNQLIEKITALVK